MAPGDKESELLFKPYEKLLKVQKVQKVAKVRRQEIRESLKVVHGVKSLNVSGCLLWSIFSLAD